VAKETFSIAQTELFEKAKYYPFSKSFILISRTRGNNYGGGYLGKIFEKEKRVVLTLVG
jgi:hypothetical protein